MENICQHWVMRSAGLAHSAVYQPPQVTRTRVTVLFFQIHPIYPATVAGIVIACVLLPQGAAAYTLFRVITGIAVGLLVARTIMREVEKREQKLIREAEKRGRKLFDEAILAGNIDEVRTFINQGVAPQPFDISNLLDKNSLPLEEGKRSILNLLALMNRGLPPALALRVSVANQDVTGCRKIFELPNGVSLENAWQDLLTMYAKGSHINENLGIIFLRNGASLEATSGDEKRPFPIFLEIEGIKLAREARQLGATFGQEELAVLEKKKEITPCMLLYFEDHRNRYIKGDPASPFYEILTCFQNFKTSFIKWAVKRETAEQGTAKFGEPESEGMEGETEPLTAPREEPITTTGETRTTRAREEEEKEEKSPEGQEGNGDYVLTKLHKGKIIIKEGCVISESPGGVFTDRYQYGCHMLLALQEIYAHLKLIETWDNKKELTENPSASFVYSMTGIALRLPASDSKQFKYPESPFRDLCEKFISAFKAVQGKHNLEKLFFESIFTYNFNLGAGGFEEIYDRLTRWIQSQP